MDTAAWIFVILALMIFSAVVGFVCGYKERSERPDWGRYELRPKNPRQL